MKKVVSFLTLLLLIFGMVSADFDMRSADARGGRGSDDCPPNSPDPDCK